MRHTPDLSTARWRKSSYSNSNGGACIEVAEGFPGAATWRKSSHSSTRGGACIEVAEGFPGVVPVRDSKNPEGSALVFRASSWVSFVEAAKSGKLSSN